MNIYVGNIPYGVKEEDLKEAFEKFGQVDSVKIIIDRVSGRSKGFGFVEMGADAEANQAIEELDGWELMGRPLRVNQARPRAERRDRW